MTTPRPGRAAAFAPLDDGTARSEAVVRRLAGAIALGLIGDGEQLPPEAELATSLRVAVVTLREALADLRDRGLLETRRGRGGGSFVRVSEEALRDLSAGRADQLGSTELRELGEHHAAVSGAAARLSAERATPNDRLRLAHTLDAFAAAPRPADRRRIDGRLFIEIAAAAQSVRLTREQVEIQTELAQLPLTPADPDRWAADAVAAHRAVLAALDEHDGGRARRLTEEHVGRRTTAMVDLHLARLAAGPAAPTALAPVQALVERVFGAVDRLRGDVLARRATGPFSVPAVDVAAVQAAVRGLLAEHRDLVVGMGLIAAPGAARRRILWWQDLGGSKPTALQVDLNPHSLGFYDYGAADWFSVPRDSGGRFVEGPYVDVHGTDRYLLTFTAPVVVPGADPEFVGIVGADVPVSRFERLLLRAWGDLGADAVVVNADGRVVVANHSGVLPGDPQPGGRPTSVPVADVGWRLLG